MTDDSRLVSDRRPYGRRKFLGTIAGATAATATLAGCLGNVDGRDDAIPEVDSPLEQTVPDGVAQFRHSLERWGYYPDATVPDAVEREWRLDRLNTGTHSAAKASAVPLPNGGVVFPGDTGHLVALDADGTERWRTGTDTDGRGIHGTPAVADGRVYVGAYDGVLYAVDAETGDIDWRNELGGSIGSSPLYHDGRIVMAVEYPDPEGSTFVVDAADGEVVWEDPEHRPTDHPHSTPAIDPDADRLVCGSNDGMLYGWSYPDLEFQWSFETESNGNDGQIKGPVATYDGGAYFGSWDHRVYRVDLEDGTEDWSFETSDLVMSGPAIDPELDTVFVGSHDGNLYALDAASGDRHWSRETDGWIYGCPIVCDDRVVAGSKDGGVYAYEKRTGEHVWTVDNEGDISSTPRVIDGAIYYAERAPNAPENPEDVPDEEIDTDGGGYKLVAE